MRYNVIHNNVASSKDCEVIKCDGRKACTTLDVVHVGLQHVQPTFRYLTRQVKKIRPFRWLSECRPSTNKPSPHCPVGYLERRYELWRKPRQKTRFRLCASPKPGNSPKRWVSEGSTELVAIGPTSARRNTNEIQWQMKKSEWKY